ncbi:hypothetical protein PG993_007900 [Apiospora rasikravindrae]|uniref:Ankyrin n=1 Tax=Apiospora rasikravindrae TaxID=990691 RepID=A0ABR1SYT5_9PEZI
MAEVLGIVSGAAGLTSLALQVASGTSRLRKAYKLTKRVPVEVDIVARDLDFICEVAKRLHCTDGHTNQADLIFVHCKSSIQAVVDALDALSQKASVMETQKGLRTSVQRLQWIPSCQDDLESLRKLAHDAKVNLMLLGQLGMVQPSMSPPLQPPQLGSSSEGPMFNVDDTSTSLQARSNRVRSRQSCLKRCCSCCCHRKGTVRHRFWAFRYTPLSMILGDCDNPTCDGRQYMYTFRVALTQLGFPWAVTAAIGIQSEATGYSIGLSLRPQHIVRYTSPGFELIYSIQQDCITLDEATTKFTEMYRKDPSFIHHVDPAGKGYIETLISDYSIDLNAVVSLLRLFISNFNMTQGLDNTNLLYNCVEWSIYGRDSHLVLLDELANLGFDLMSLAEPVSPDRFGEPVSHYRPYFKNFQKLIHLDPDFGNTSSTQRDILQSPEKTLTTLRRNPECLDTTSNFLGQTPLHLAITQNDSELTRALLDAGHPLNVLDWYGKFPLDYTAALGHSTCAKLLLSEDADIMYPLSSTSCPTYLSLALLQDQHSYIFEIIQHIQISFPDDNRQTLCSSISKHVLSYIAFDILPRPLLHYSCDDITFLVNMIDDINFELYPLPIYLSHHSERRQLLHYPWPLEYAKIFVGHGYTGINRKDGSGITPLMVASSEGIPTLVQYYIEMNALVNDQDHVGSTSLTWALREWIDYDDLVARDEGRDYPGTVKLLLQAGADVSMADCCRCSCSDGGCVPLQVYSCQSHPGAMYLYEDAGLFVALEWLNLLKELGREDDSRISLVKLIRRYHFEELELGHTCDLEKEDPGEFLHIAVRSAESDEKHALLGSGDKAHRGYGV